MLEKEMLEKIGVIRREIIFTKPVKAMVRDNDGLYDKTRENVTSINVDQSQAGASISVVYKTDTGEGSLGTPLEYIKEIIIVNE